MLNERQTFACNKLPAVWNEKWFVGNSLLLSVAPITKLDTTTKASANATTLATHQKKKIVAVVPQQGAAIKYNGQRVRKHYTFITTKYFLNICKY